jgi:sirohydrochlorin ferrochelatase
MPLSSIQREKTHGKSAVILIGHGSRAAGADDAMGQIAGRLREERGGIVEVCRMGGRGAPFGETFARCVQQGAETIIVLPYFLHFGVHLRRDLPEILREAAAGHPEIRLVLGRHLGFDDFLVALCRKRIAESEALCDVRELTPVPIDGRPDDGASPLVNTEAAAGDGNDKE